MSQPKFRKVPISELIIDPAYQREINEPHLAKLASDFRPDMLGALEVSRRNGHYAVFEGQHRYQAARLVNFDVLPCLVHEGLTQAQEAEMFYRHQRDRKPIHPVAAFKARRVAGDPVAVEIYEIVENFGFSIQTHPTPDVIASPMALTRIYARGNLAETLELLRSLWGGDEKSTDYMLLDGLSALLQGYGHRLTDEHLARLREVPAAVVVRRAISRQVAQGGRSVKLPTMLSTLRKIADLTGPPLGSKNKRKAAA